MKRAKQVAVLACAILAMGTAMEARADVVTLVPEQAAVVSAQGVEDTQVVLQFDLSGLSGARVDLAVLDWEVTGMSSEAFTEYRLVPITASWTAGGVATTAPTLAGTDAGWWEYSPLDYERNSGGLIRFDATALVKDWIAGKTANHGLAIMTTDLDRETVAGQLGNVRLILTYLP
jgi:hypothetical protein